MYNKLVRLSLGRDFSNFDPYTIKFSELPNLLCTPNVLYSPTQFNEHKRKSANFMGFADFLVLDFDEGWDIYHENLFNKYIGYKVPTKSHMKEKNGIICERYRVLLLLDTPIMLNYQEYKRLYKHIMRDLNLNSDSSCVDACRFYYSAQQDVKNCIQLQGTKCFPWQKYNYKDLQYASLYRSDNSIDISAFKGIDISYLSDLKHSKRYPCPICRLEGYDQKGHHLAYNKDEDYPTCFFDEEHSKILRKLYKQYKYGTIEDKMEDINDMVREKCTPELIKVAKYDPKPSNYSDNLLDFYDKALAMLETDDKIDLDIETFCEYYVDETLEEAEERLSHSYKYIKGAYQSKWNEYKGVALDPFKNKIRIITLGGGGAVCPFDMYYATEQQKQRLLNLIRDKFIIGHNLKFDIKSIIASYGIEYCPSYCFDTMLASRMIHMAQDPEDAQMGHNLKAAAFRFLDYKMDKEVDHTWGNDNLTPRQLQYAGDDVKILRPLFNEQVRQFKELYGPPDTVNYDFSKIAFLGPLMNEHPLLALEMQTLLEVIRIEFAGVKPNIPMMRKAIDEFNKQIDDADAELGINCGSSKDCIKFLQERVDPSITSSNAGTLSQYEDDPLVKKMKEAKAARTRRGLMVSMSDTNVHPYDNRIHPTFNQLLNTGRFACSNPNMQQIPKTIKNDIYVSDEDGIVFDADYAAVELRIETVVANDPVMLAAYKQNQDMHYLTASKIFGREIPHTKEEKEDAEKNEDSKFIAKWQRGFAKACNFGLIYGIAKKSFISMNAWTGLSEELCSKAYDTFFETYTGINHIVQNAKAVFDYGTDKEITRWIEYKNGSMHKQLKKVPFFTVVKTLFGRMLAVDTERKMMNYPTQGSGADIIKVAICKLGYETRQVKTSYKTINMVHDDTIGHSRVIDFDENSVFFRGALEFAVNYVLRYKFYTPVNQDFCVLSLLGEGVFLEEALTLQDIDDKLVAKIKHQIELAQKEQDNEEREKLTNEINREHKLLLKFRDYLDKHELIKK